MSISQSGDSVLHCGLLAGVNRWPHSGHLICSESMRRGIVDVANRIVYHTEPAPAQSDTAIGKNRVTSVSYLDVKAPVLKGNDPLGSTADALLADARTMASYLPSSQAGSEQAQSAQVIKLPRNGRPEPFGFHVRMTPDEIISVVGKAALKQPLHPQDYGDSMAVSYAPKPNNSFDDYTLKFSLADGLFEVRAWGKAIESAGDGAKVREKFNELRELISAKYGHRKVALTLVTQEHQKSRASLCFIAGKGAASRMHLESAERRLHSAGSDGCDDR